MVYVIVVILLVGVVWLVGGPILRSTSGPGASEELDRDGLRRSERRIDLEAARDAKYREIRDAELDHQTGKLSDDDFGAIDGTLRAEAMELLHQLDAIEILDDDSGTAVTAEPHERATTPGPE